MAEKKARKLRPEDVGALPQAQADEMQKVLEKLQANWKQYAAGAALVCVCLIAYAVFQAVKSENELKANSLYAKALMEEDLQKRLPLLEEAVALGSGLKAEIQYVLGEQAIHAEEYDKAKNVMTQFLAENPDSEFAVKAADALAFLKLNDGDTEGAIKAYEDLKVKWPNTLEALVVPTKIAKIQEKNGNIESAVASYREQITLFPDSATAESAQVELDRIKLLKPELFPDDEELKELIALEAPVEAPAETVETPLEEAQVEMAPTEQAPAVETAPVAEAAPAENPPAPEVEEPSVETEETPAAE